MNVFRVVFVCVVAFLLTAAFPQEQNKKASTTKLSENNAAEVIEKTKNNAEDNTGLVDETQKVTKQKTGKQIKNSDKKSEPNPKPTIAVFNLSTTFSADSEVSRIVAEQIRTELIKTELFKVTDGAEMDRVLHNNAVKQFDSCNSQSCMADAGHIIGVHRLVYGSIANVNGFYTVVLRLLNVPRGEVISTVTQDFNEGRKELVSKNVTGLVNKLLRDTENKETQTSAPVVGLQKKGVLLIDADRAGSKVYIDGKEIDQKAPATVEKMPAGEHVVIARDGAWYGKKEVSLAPDSTVMVTIPMREGTGTLVVTSNEQKVDVAIDGARKGKVPFSFAMIPMGEHELVFTKEGFEPIQQVVTIDSAEVESLSVEMKAIAAVTVKTKPASAAVYINNVYVGQGNNATYTVSAGTLEISFEAPGCKSVKITETCKAGEKKTIEQQLESLFGSLEVFSRPSDVPLFINGEQIGLTPYNNPRINTGKYSCTLIMDNYNAVTEDIIVGPNQNVKRDYALKYTKAYRDSLVHDRWTRNGLQRVRRLAFSFLTIASGAVAAYYHQETLSERNAYNAAAVEYDQATAGFQSYKDSYIMHRNKAEDYYTLRNLAISAGAVCFTGFCISVLF